MKIKNKELFATLFLVLGSILGFAQPMEIFKVVEEMPLFPSSSYEEDMTHNERSQISQKEMIQFIYEEIQYPAEARENKIEGTVVVKFVITDEGYIRDAEVDRAIGGGCDEEALRVVNSMNGLVGAWIPGKQNGKNKNVLYRLPIRFKTF